MKYVVTPNYLDRSSPYRWLVREYDADTSTCVAYKRVTMKTASLGRANKDEVGFGCSIVLVAEGVEGFEKEEKSTKLFVTPYGAVYHLVDYGERVYLDRSFHLTSVKLSPDGSFHAII